MSSQPDNTLVPEVVEEVCPGLTCEWFYGKRIITYRITSVSQSIIETWASTVITNIQNWPQGQPYLALHDLSKPGVSLQYASLVGFDTTNIGVTPSGREQVDEIVDKRPDFLAQVAVNFSLSLSGQVNKLLADRRNTNPFVQYRLFYSREKSLEWLSLAAKPSEGTSEDTKPS